MKKLILILAVAVSLMGCAALKNTKSDIFLSLGKSAIADILYVDLNSLEKDSVNITSIQDRDRVRAIIGRKLQKTLTPKGEIKSETLDFYASFSWVVLEDSVRVKVKFVFDKK